MNSEQWLQSLVQTMLTYSQAMYGILLQQAERLDRIEGRLSRLEADLSEWRGKETTHIDSIQYHFDQLKVEKLEGALHIGVTPSGVDGIEQLAMNGMPADSLYPRICQEVRNHLQQDGRDLIRSVCEVKDYELEEHLYEDMIRDMERQSMERVAVYLRKQQGVPDGYEKERSITEQVKQDIRTAVENYVERKKEDAAS